jgi:hypothetical protein
LEKLLKGENYGKISDGLKKTSYIYIKMEREELNNVFEDLNNTMEKIPEKLETERR